MATTPQEMAHHLAFLQMDLTDPDFHRRARTHAMEQERQLRALLTSHVRCRCATSVTVAG